MSESQAEFNAALDKFIANAKKEASKRLRRAGMVALRRIVFRTPVLTGCCRANWRVDFGSMQKTFDAKSLDKGGGKTISTCAARLQSAVVGTDFFISNSTPYVVPLEYGYSRQALAGMVRITANDIKGLIEIGSL